MERDVNLDSFFADPKPKCCDPFPGLNLKFCWEVDSTYCSTCGRWLEHPYDHIKRAEKHSRECPNECCTPRPKFCMCGHNEVQHHKSMLLKSLMGKPEEEFLPLFHRMRKGPHNCEFCECAEWEPNYDGPCD